MLFLIVSWALLWQACFQVLASSTPNPPNILLIIADDYRPEGRIGLDPHPGGQLFGTPNLDKLARQSIVYDAAFATSPSCGPSRTSFLTGYTPDKLRYWSFVSNHWRDSGRAKVSLPEYFRSKGYRTVALGKIFHWDDVHRDDAEYSWDKVTYTGPFSGGESKCSAPGELFCRCLDNDNCVDENLAREAMGELTWLSNQNKPWFLALGFRRPHMDWALPRGWIEANGMATAPIPMPRYREMDTSVPNEAFYACGPVLEVKGENSLPQGAHLSDALTEKIRRYYWATVNFMDIQLGKVLNHFDSKFPQVSQNTIVVFMSDHGWSLGERGLWCKQNLFDDSNRVALMIRAPWLQKAGTRVTRPVSVLSLFPTLVDLTKIKVPDFAECFGSVSLFSDASEDEVVISQFPRCDAAKGANPYSNPCMNEKPAAFKLMGYSVRTKSFRYTEWRRWTGPATQADWSDEGLVAAELYDHRGNNMSPSVVLDYEVVNVYDNPNYASIRASLAFQLRTTITKPSWASACSITQAPSPKPTSLAPTKNPTTKAPTSSPTTKTKAPTAITTARPTPGPTNPPTLTNGPTIATKMPTSKAPTKTPTTKSPTTPQTTKSPTTAALPLLKSDLEAFQELYDATNGPQWTSCATSRHDPCNNLVNGCNLRTHFIVCELVNNELRLIELSLPDNNMVGSLPESLFSLPTLTIVDLRTSTGPGNSRKNSFSNSECVVAPLCMEADTSCNVANTGVDICATIPANKCFLLTQLQCKANANLCHFFPGGYGCQSKSFCGFLSKSYLKNKVPAKLAKMGIKKGAPGCMGKENVKRCVWKNNRCVARSAVKNAKKKKKKKKKNG